MRMWVSGIPERFDVNNPKQRLEEPLLGYLGLSRRLREYTAVADTIED